MPTIATHVPEDWEYAAAFSSNVDRNYRGKPAPYLRELIEKDLNGLSIGTAQSAWSTQRIGEMQAAETALFKLELLAREWMFAGEAERPGVTRRMVTAIFDATRRPGATYPESGVEAFPQVAEAGPPGDPPLPPQPPSPPAKPGPGPKVAPPGPALTKEKIAASKAGVERRLEKGKDATA